MPMHILFVIHSLSAGGAERVTTTLANYWDNDGWQVTIVTMASRERDFYPLNSEIKRIALKLDSDSSNFMHAVSNNFRRIRALRAVLKKEKPDVAIAVMTTANCLLSVAGLGLPTPIIGSEHTHPPAMPLSSTWEALRRWSYARLSVLVALTQQSADWLQQNTLAPRVEIIPNATNYPIAIKEPRIPPANSKRTAAYSHSLLSVGRLAEEKGFDRLITAFSMVCYNYPEWVLVIVGEGVLRTDLESQVHALGISDRVQFPGAVGNVGEWYEAADLYVLSSRFEGLPVTLLEALAHGLPAVAVDCETGPRDIIRHDTDGLLVPQNDPGSLALALSRLMGDEVLRERFAARAIEARERFSLARIASMWEDLLMTLVEPESR